MDAAELFSTLEMLLESNVPLHKVDVQLVQGHPDYQGPDVESPLFAWNLVGRTLRLSSQDSKDVQE